MSLKIISRAAKILIFLIVILIYLETRGIPRSRELECGLPDGSAFIQKQEYEWSLLGQVLPHVSKELNTTTFDTYFRDTKGGEIGPVSGGPPRINLNDFEEVRFECALFGLAQGRHYYSSIGYLLPGGKKLIEPTYIENFELGIIETQTVPIHIKAGVQSGVLKKSRGAFIAQPPHVTLEYALENSADPRKPIVAVFHYESLDGGKTWSGLVPSAPKMFELGKPLLEQCFIARPVRVDGKKVKAVFPACPAAAPAGQR